MLLQVGSGSNEKSTGSGSGGPKINGSGYSSLKKGEMNCTINGLKRLQTQLLELKYNKYLPGVHLCLLLSQLSVDASQLGFLLRLLGNQGLYTLLSRGKYIFRGNNYSPGPINQENT